MAIHWQKDQHQLSIVYSLVVATEWKIALITFHFTVRDPIELMDAFNNINNKKPMNSTLLTI